jgi:CubicO group peptidase (beta-lactamase class C family)
MAPASRAPDSGGALPPGDSVILSEEAFGHLGNGGSLGFADPRARLSFGYTMNRMDGWSAWRTACPGHH